MPKVYAVGVGPGSPKYVTRAAEEAIACGDVVVGYEHTLKTIGHLLDGKEVISVTMATQEEEYQRLLPRLDGKALVVPFTGDASFSESEVVDRLIELFGDVTIVPGISSVQAAAARTAVPLDKSKVITLHVTGSIEEQKLELARALVDGFSVILVPRPWPKMPERHFMPSEIALYLRRMGVDTSVLKVHVFESITSEEEAHFEGVADDLEGMEFSPLSIMVFDQAGPDSYMNYAWQWRESPAGPDAP